MSQDWHFVVVNGYGCHVNAEVQEYLDEVVRFINEHEPSYLILCGGQTQRKTAPGITEAAVMAIYIRQRLSHVPMFILEDDSLTTLENVQNATRRILNCIPRYGNYWPSVEMTVFCEAQRALKTLILYWFLLPQMHQYYDCRIRVKTSSWELGNPLKELSHLLFDLAALWVPGLTWYAHRKLLKKSASR